MDSTKHLDVTDGSSNIVRRVLANSFGWALTPVLLMVVLVPFNHMTTLALVQLGIWNNYSNNLSLEILKGDPTSPRQDSPANRVKRSFDWLGEADPVLPDWQNPVPGPSDLSIYTFMGGGRAIPSHRLHMHEPWITQAHGAALTVPPTVSTNPIYSQVFFHWQCRWFGGGTGQEDLID